jgi:hypothetical protein
VACDRLRSGRAAQTLGRRAEGFGGAQRVRASYWQKYFVHRTVRPEAYGGLAHHRLANGVSDYPLHDNFLVSRNENVATLAPDHPDERTAHTLLMESLGSADNDFVDGLLAQAGLICRIDAGSGQAIVGNVSTPGGGVPQKKVETTL